MKDNRNIKKILLIIGIIPFILNLFYSLFYTISNNWHADLFDIEQENGIKALILNYNIVVCFTFPVFIIATVLIIISIILFIKGSKKKE